MTRRPASPVSSTSGITGSTTASFSYAFDLVEAFDLIELGGDDLRREPLQVRSHPSCQGRSRHPVQRAGNATTARCLHPCLRPLPACVFAPCHVTLAAMRRCLRHRPPCSPRRCLGPDACIHAFALTAPLMRSCLQGPGRAPHDHPDAVPGLRHRLRCSEMLQRCADAFAIAPHAVQDVALAPMPASMDRKTVMTETPSPLGKMQYALALTVVPLQFFSITSPFCSFSAKT